jgi:hypothetical protein
LPLDISPRQAVNSLTCWPVGRVGRARGAVVVLREVDANLQEIDTEFQVLVAELLLLVRFAYA